MGIRIQPRDLEVPEETPFLHDRLDRKTPARVLTQIVASVEGPCVLSIDGPFGAGKSTFLRLWTQHLKNEGFPVARLNAWAPPDRRDARCLQGHRNRHEELAEAESPA